MCYKMYWVDQHMCVNCKTALNSFYPGWLTRAAQSTVIKKILKPQPECVPPHNLGLKYSPFFDKTYLRTSLLFKKVKILIKEYLDTWGRVCNPHIWGSIQRLRSFFSCLDLFFKKSKQRHMERWKNWKYLKKKGFCFYQAQKLEEN